LATPSCVESPQEASLAGGARRAQLGWPYGIHARVHAGHDPPIIVELPEMVRKVDREVHEVVTRLDSGAADRLGKVGGQLSRAHGSGCGLDRSARGSDLPQQHRPRHVSAGELGGPVTHVASARHPGAEIVLEIASEMQDQRAADSRDARYLSPQILLVGVGFDFALESRKVPVEHGRNRHQLCRLPSARCGHQAIDGPGAETRGTGESRRLLWNRWNEFEASHHAAGYPRYS
jgi:hypothetical protein